MPPWPTVHKDRSQADEDQGDYEFEGNALAQDEDPAQKNPENRGEERKGM